MSSASRTDVTSGVTRGDGHAYVLVTAAYNEEQHIEKTLESVVSQRVAPDAWVIVSDGSTDATDEIVGRYAEQHAFIRFVRVEKDQEHCFAAKVRALENGFAALEGLDYDFIGILDADISFEGDYFERLLQDCDREPRLGVTGGNVIQWVDGRLEKRIKDLNTVAGAVQLFRRECFEATGGFPPLQYGGEDAAMETTARMRGWRVRTNPELQVIHYGVVGQGAGGRLRARFKWGKMNYCLGYHPLFELARCAYRVVEKPYLVGSVAEILGFLAASREFDGPQIDPGVARFLRWEQLRKLKIPVAGPPVG